MADVFVSHSSMDKAIADELVSHLEEKGIKCWIAPRDILPGSEWAVSINNAISESKIMIVIYSANSAASTQVPKELTIADRKDKFIIPYMVDKTELFGSFEYFFTGAHWINADPRNNDFKTDELYGVISGVLKMDGNTFTKNASVNTEEHKQEKSFEDGSAVKIVKTEKKLSIKETLIIVVAIIAAAAIIFVAVSMNNDTADNESNNSAFGAKDIEDTIDHTVTKGDNIYKGTYFGDSLNGVPDGNGKFIGIDFKGNTFTYTGEFKSGLLCGTGLSQETYSDDELSEVIYDGEWSDNNYNGNGKETCNYANGDVKVYEGNWIDGKLNGKGTFKGTYIDDDVAEATYEGEWENGVAHGQGVHVIYYSNGDVVEREGEWVNNELNGQGKWTYKYSNGDVNVFEGEMINGKIFGQGRIFCTYTNGIGFLYEGELENSLPNGQGKQTSTYANGDIEVYEGEFENGAFIG